MKLNYKVIIYIVILILFMFYRRSVFAVVINEEVVPNYYILDSTNSENKIAFRMFINPEKNEFLYSVNPLVTTNNSKIRISYYNHSKYLNISEDKWYRLMDISYFGYGYLEHTDIIWYLITQNIIWNELGLNVTIVDDENINIYFKYKEEYNEIINLVDSFQVKPSYFNDEEIDINFGDNLLLEDLNGVEENFKFNTTGYSKIINIDNKKYFTSPKPMQAKIYGSKIYKSEENNTIYFSDDIKLFNRRGPKVRTYILNVNVHGGFIKLNNIDSLGNSLSGSVYRIKDDYGNIVDTLYIKGQPVSSKYLPLGKYYIEEEKSAYQYKSQSKIMVVNLKDYDATEVDIISEPITSKVSIKLLYKYDNSDKIIGEKGATFGVFLGEKLLFQNKTDSNGNIIFDLPIGTYVLKQLSSTLDFSLQQDIEVSVTNDNDLYFEFINTKKHSTLNDDIIDDKIVACLNKTKIDSDEVNALENNNLCIERDDSILKVDQEDEIIILDVPYTGIDIKYGLFILLFMLGLFLFKYEKI